MKPIVTRLLGIAILLLLAAEARGAYRRLHSFGDGAHTARTPMAGLTDGGDGYYYGVSQFGVTVNAGTLFRVHPDGTGWNVIHSFTPLYPLGQEIYSHLAISNGILYGTRNATFAGSSTSLAYSITTNGGAYSVLHTFNSIPNDGKTSSGGLTLDGNGFLYGVTSDGGTNNGGTVFKMQLSGAGYTVLRSFENPFQNNGTNSRTPIGELALDAGQFLYGVTASGGSDTNGGTIFRIKTDGSGFSKLHDFLSTANDGHNPMTGLALDASGFLFGVTANGGTNDTGCVFKLKTDGSSYARLHDFIFGFADVYSPDEKLFLGGDGFLYGASSYGGTNFSGGLFKLATDGSAYSVFYSFTGGPLDGSSPVGGVIRLNSGALIGESSSGGTVGQGSVYQVQPDGSGFSNLASFIIAGGDASQPESGLTLGTDGFLYGTTVAGGSYLNGTIYKISTNGTGYTVLHEFLPVLFGGSDGSQPTAAPVFFTDGFLYGTTTHGGTNGGGIIYKIHPDGTGYAHVHDFAGGTADGSQPDAELIFTTDGILFGTTQLGGTNNSGIVFKSNRNGSLVVLHHFGSGTDGSQPTCALTLGSGGYLYGTAQSGGARGGGTVFKLKTDGTGYTNLYAFDGNSSNYDGISPLGGVVFGPDGFLYGTTSSGGFSQYLADSYEGTGVYYGAGTVFKLDVNGTNYSQLYSFYNSLGDPAYPQAGLTPGNDGYLYGTAQFGGVALYGAVFKIDTNGVLATVCSFRNSSLGAADGAVPYAGITFGTDGTMYGTTLNGGDVNLGTVFSVNARVVFTQESKQENGVHLAHQSIVGTKVILQRATNLLGWTNLSTNVLPNNSDGYAAYTDIDAPPPKAYYRAITP